MLAGAAARGSFLAGRHAASGWGQLSIETDGAYSDEQQALALGYLEGWLTGGWPHAARLACAGLSTPPAPLCHGCAAGL